MLTERDALNQQHILTVTGRGTNQADAGRWESRFTNGYCEWHCV